MNYKLVTLVVEIQALVPQDTIVSDLCLMNKKSDFKINHPVNELDFEVIRYGTYNVIDHGSTTEGTFGEAVRRHLANRNE